MSASGKLFVELFLRKVRDFVGSEGLNLNRLPGWIRSASIQNARVEKTNIYIFEDSSRDYDSFDCHGSVWSDLQFLLNLSEYIPISKILQAPKASKIILTCGEYGANGKVTLNIQGIYPSLFNVESVSYHSPLALVNIFLQLSDVERVTAVRFIPFAIYIHDRDFADFEVFWDKCTPHLLDVLRFIHDSEAGDYYQSIAELKKAILVSKERSVLVFGSYSDADLDELMQIRDYLRKSYDAYLLIELPKNPSMSLEEKVKLWASASKFCIMIDRSPSGHLLEYDYLKSARVVLAFLRSKHAKSTSMIEDNPIDFPFIRTFKFEDSPLEIIDVAVKWAEEYVEAKAGN